MYIKTIKVTNPKSVLIQIPGFIANKWNLTKEDGVEVHISDDEKTIILKPRKRLNKVYIGSDSNEESERLVKYSIGC